MQKGFILIFCLLSFLGYSQAIEQNWNFHSIVKEGTEIISIDESDTFHLKEGKFKYTLVAKDSLIAEGNYIRQNNLLIFNYHKPKDTVRYYNIAKLTDSLLTITENNISYHFHVKSNGSTTIKTQDDTASVQIIPSQGFSLTSLWMGVLGMFVLICIAFLFSSNL